MSANHTPLLSSLITVVLFTAIYTDAEARFRKHVIMPKHGIYEMRNTYTADDYRFNTSSDSVWGFEYERRFQNGLTIGTEYFHFTNDFSTPTGRNDTLKMDYAFFVSKYYFNSPDRLKPFIGLGAGYGTGRTNQHGGAIDGEAYQFLAGIAYDWDRFGMVFHYKNMYSKVDRDPIDTPIGRFPGGATFDVSGEGLFAGFVVKF